MKLQFYNSITSQKEEFKPMSNNEVLVYGCGPTVYNAPHIGNFRTFVFYDLIKNYFITLKPECDIFPNPPST